MRGTTKQHPPAYPPFPSFAWVMTAQANPPVPAYAFGYAHNAQVGLRSARRRARAPGHEPFMETVDYRSGVPTAPWVSWRAGGRGQAAPVTAAPPLFSITECESSESLDPRRAAARRAQVVPACESQSDDSPTLFEPAKTKRIYAVLNALRRAVRLSKGATKEVPT